MKPERILNNIIKFLLIAIAAALLFMLFSCGTKKTFSDQRQKIKIDTITVVQTEIDTVFKEKTIEKTKPVYFETVIEKPCDSLGNIRPINAKIGTGQNKALIYTKNGKLFVSAKIDSTKNALAKEYRARWEQDSINLRKKIIKETAVVQKTVKTVWPWWLWAALIIGGVSVIYNIYQKISPV